MDKYDLVLDLVEHPDRYSDAQITEILSDTECKEFYTLLCKTGAAIRQKHLIETPDIEREWRKVSASRPNVARLKFLRPGMRAASIVALSLTSLAAVALGVAVAVKHTSSPATPVMEEMDRIDSYTAAKDTCVTDTIPVVQSSDIPTEPVLYKDEQLGKLLEVIAKCYGVTVEYRNEETAGLHLYYKFNPALPLEEVVDQLNTFERINIHIDGNTLIVD